ncbi:hypothetical protein COU54_01985 [Candidatus Pacearchaeota archaeon CG10_big_fil_rev_8_21_14_0_10_31_24]|nr:MAG: hypothetical protein COU54_01985 [Candidatus Pacearchaeota archaeon CG10_big_fil_rev_8_21_14_0_10_31_24]
MKKFSLIHKKGISISLSYVLLIILMISIASIVFSFLGVLTPKDNVECTKDLELNLLDSVCKINGQNIELSLTIENEGKFSVDGAYIRLGPESKKIKYPINEKDPYLEVLSKVGGLPPGEKFFKTYTVSKNDVKVIESSEKKNILEIEPAFQSDKGLALCSKDISSYRIACN